MTNFRYTKSPTTYSDELRKKGQRAKARAYWEYAYDIEDGEENSLRFYARSWGVSKTTADRWKSDFEEKYKLYLSAMELYNMRQNKHAKNEGGHNRDSSGIKKHSETTSTPKEEESCGTVEGQHEDKALNQYNNNSACDERLFLDLFNIYNMNTKFPGSKAKALTAYENMYMQVSHKSLIESVVFYLHDPSREGKLNNLENFLKNEVYANYMPKHIRVISGGVWLEGVYDKETEIFTTTDNQRMLLHANKLSDKFAKGELEFIREVAA